MHSKPEENNKSAIASSEAAAKPEFITNPALLAELPDRSNELKGRAKYLYTSFTPETLALVLTAAEKGEILSEWATVCLLGHHGGIFASTVVNLEWTAISFKRGTVKYVEKWVGQWIPYEIPLPAEVLAYLAEARKQMSNARYLCPMLRTRTQLCDRWAAVVKKLALPRISLTSMCSPYRRQHERRTAIVGNIRGAIKLTRRWLGEVWVNVFLHKYGKPLLEKEGLDVKNFGLFPLDENATEGGETSLEDCADSSENDAAAA